MKDTSRPFIGKFVLALQCLLKVLDTLHSRVTNNEISKPWKVCELTCSRDDSDGSDSWTTPLEFFAADLPFPARRVKCVKEG